METWGAFICRMSESELGHISQEDISTMQDLLWKMDTDGEDISRYLALGNLPDIAKQMIKDVAQYMDK